MGYRPKIKTILAFILVLCCLGFFNAGVYADVFDKVIAVVNEEVVTQRDFDKMFLPLKQDYMNRFKGGELEQRLEAARGGLLEQLVNAKLTVSLAKKEKIEVDEEELQGRIDKIKTYYKSEEEFLGVLDEKGTTLTEFNQEIRDQMLAQKLVEQEVASKIIISPAEIKDLYEKNKKNFVSPVKSKVRNLMLRKKKNAEENEVIKSNMEELLSKVEDGEDFGELAEKYSEGPYAKNGGDMGYVIKGQILPEIENAVFVLKKNEHSKIVETHVGYHIFKVEDIQEPRMLELEEVSDFLKEQLYMKKFQEALLTWLEEKRKDAYISYK
ncbi:MAG: peptidylprolyl isomerase [Candidatus Omnitrophota bacterium]